MEIIFCSVCNESIPAGDLAEKRAVQHAGRAICVRCEAAMSTRAESDLAEREMMERDMEDTALSAEIGGNDTQVVEPLRVPAPKGGPGGLSVGIAAALAGGALLVASGTGAFLLERGNRLGAELERVEGTQAALKGDVERAERSLGAAIGEVQGSLARSAQVLAGLTTEIERLSSREAAASDALGNDLAGIAARLTEIEGVRAAIGGQSEELVRLQGRIDGFRQELELLAARVAEEAELAKAPTVEAQAPAEPAAPAWRAFVADLQNANSGVRWQAVQSLGAAGDPAVVELLLSMLSDTDIFVRMATARVLGDLGSTAAVAALIEALEDAEASVREAADVALRAITGQDFEFDAGAKDAERSKRVKAWRDWWRRFSEEKSAASSRNGARRDARA